jgi:hypothetical protein
MERVVSRALLSFGILSALVAFTAPIARAETIETLTFDDLGPDYGPMPAHYGGLNWDENFYVISSADYQYGYGNTYGAPSELMMAFNWAGTMEAVVSDGHFNFLGAYFSGWAMNDAADWFTATSMTATGYLGDVLIGQATIALPADGFVWLDANIRGIDRLVLSSSGDTTWWLMDDFTYSHSPEPATLALVGGALGVGALARRRRAARSPK